MHVFKIAKTISFCFSYVIFAKDAHVFHLYMVLLYCREYKYHNYKEKEREEQFGMKLGMCPRMEKKNGRCPISEAKTNIMVEEVGQCRVVYSLFYDYVNV